MAVQGKKLRIVVLGGCGAQGSFATRDIVRRGVFDEVVVADLDIEAANRFAQALASPNVSTRRVDVLDKKSLMAGIQDADLVMNCTGPYYLLGPAVVTAAIEAGKHYIDFCDDIVAHEQMVLQDAAAKAKDLIVLVGLGASPGLAPLIVVHAASQMESVTDVHFPQMIHNAEPEGPAVVYHLIANFFGQVPVIRDGQRVYVNAFEGEEEVDFGPPLGKARVSPFGHPEIFTLPRVLPDIRTMAVKLGTYPVEVYETMKLLAQAGLASPDPITVKGYAIAPRDFLIAMLLAERHAEPPADYTSAMLVEVTGRKDGKRMTVKYNVNGRMGPATGLPCSLGAEWIAQNKITRRGVVFPEECIAAEPFLDEVFKRIREISVITTKETVVVQDEWL
jgi:saccharopine dehydrogenase-like NADP-dependent oxidoreductase